MTTLHDRIITLGILFAGVPAIAPAQARVEVGTGELRVRGQPAAGAVTVAPQFTSTTTSFRLWTAGTVSLTGNGSARSALQSALTTTRPVILGVLSPILTVRGQDDPFAGIGRNRRVDGAVGVRIGNAQLSASAGMGLARSAHASFSRSVQTSNVDVHLLRGGFRLRVGYEGNAFDASVATPGSQSGFSLARTRISDLTSDASWRLRGVEIGGSLGRRIGGSDDHGRFWGGGFASLKINDRIAIVARQETTPSDPTRHLAAQRLATLGFRIRPALVRARYDDGSDAAQFRREFVVSRIHGDTHGLRVFVPDASTVELAGSFNEWTPVVMRSAGGGWWELTLSLAPGLYSLNFRADGGTWKVPQGLNAVSDEFNGMVGVMLIP